MTEVAFVGVVWVAFSLYLVLYYHQRLRRAEKLSAVGWHRAKTYERELCRLKARILLAAAAPTIEDARTILAAGEDDDGTHAGQLNNCAQRDMHDEFNAGN